MGTGHGQEVGVGGLNTSHLESNVQNDDGVVISSSQLLEFYQRVAPDEPSLVIQLYNLDAVTQNENENPIRNRNGNGMK